MRYRYVTITMTVFATCMLVFFGIAYSENAVATSKATDYIVKGNIPMFSFEDPVKLQVKVFKRHGKDHGRLEEIRNAHVVFEIMPATGPPPYGHDKEMAYYEMILAGQTEDPEVQEYLEYLNNLSVSQEKSLHKNAVYDHSTGYYTASHIFMRFPWGIRVYVAEPYRDLRKTDAFFPLRAHCAYFDVANIEFVKISLHHLASEAKEQNWTAAEQKYNSILDSLQGKHGMYFMVGAHHGWDISEFQQHMTQLQGDIANQSYDSLSYTVMQMFDTLQEYEDYFGSIEVNPTSSKHEYRLTVWDQVNQWGVTDAIVVIQENYDIENEVINPAIVPFQRPDESMYHAKVSYIPEGIYAVEEGEGNYIFKSETFMKDDSPKRIFVYYVLGIPGIPSKFITKELYLDHD